MASLKGMLPQEIIDSLDDDARGFLRGVTKEYERSMARFTSEESQEYFHNFVAAFMLEFHKAYENFDIRIPYRIKSKKSVFEKIMEYLYENEKSVKFKNEFNETEGKLKEDITDMLAMTVLACNRPATFYSNDPQIQALVEEKRSNHALLGALQKFELECKSVEFSGIKPDQYDYKCSKLEYYLHSIIMINRIKALVHPNATDLLKKYDDMLKKIEEKIPKDFFTACNLMSSSQELMKKANTSEKVDTMLTTMRAQINGIIVNDKNREFLYSPIDESDVKTVDYIKTLNDFTSRIHDKLDLAVLTRQVESVFETSELLKKFGVSIDKGSEKEKRQKSGYVSNFMYLNTPFGKIEMQLQSQHENLEGNIGYSAHCDMPGKGLSPIAIPKDLSNKKLVDRFRDLVEFISPKKFLAQFDNSEPNRILTQINGKYQNYKSVVTQVRRGSEAEKNLKKYFHDLYDIRTRIFEGEAEQERVESFVEYDIDEYIKSPNLKRILESAKKRQMPEGQEDGTPGNR